MVSPIIRFVSQYKFPLGIAAGSMATFFAYHRHLPTQLFVKGEIDRREWKDLTQGNSKPYVDLVERNKSMSSVIKEFAQKGDRTAQEALDEFEEEDKETQQEFEELLERYRKGEKGVFDQETASLIDEGKLTVAQDGWCLKKALGS